MSLPNATQRALEKALEAREKGQLVSAVAGLVTIATGGRMLRLMDGVCFDGPDPAWVGAELVGWLEELDGLSGVGAWWRPGLRAVLLDAQTAIFTVTRPALVVCCGGSPVPPGFATQSARFLVAQDDADCPRSASSGLPVPTWTMMGRGGPLSLSNGFEPTLPAGTLRSRGAWRSTTVSPWDLGEGMRTPRPAARRAFGPLPPVRPPPRRSVPAGGRPSLPV